MTSVLLMVTETGRAFLAHGPEGQSRAKHFDESEDVLDFLAWCSEHRCSASGLFSIAIHMDGGRVWKITPQDEDAAFALKVRWL